MLDYDQGNRFEIAMTPQRAWAVDTTAQLATQSDTLSVFILSFVLTLLFVPEPVLRQKA